MNWKVKAAVQCAIAMLPRRLSYYAYLQLQRRCGALRASRWSCQLDAGAAFARQLIKRGRSLHGATVLEVGTGWRLNLPVALWLCGADRLVTVDVNPYLKWELVRQDLSYLLAHDAESLQALPEGVIDRHRWILLMDMARSSGSLAELTELCHIEYLAPADARNLPLDDGSVDYHVSYTTLEHIPPDILAGIFREAKRVLRGGGLCLHCTDHSDHFAAVDPTITKANFLKYSDAMWNRVAGSRYAYCNRLRVDDLRQIVEHTGLRIASLETVVDERSLVALRSGDIDVLEPRFRQKPLDVLATCESWLLASK